MLQAAQLLRVLATCGNTRLGLHGVGRGRLRGCHCLPHPTRVAQAQGSGGLSGRKLALTELAFCVSCPPLPRNPQVEVSGAWLPHSLRGQETGLQAGTPLLTSPGGPFPGAGALQVLHVACRQVVCDLRPSWTQRPRRGWQDWVPGALCLLRRRHAGLPAPITFTASPGEEGPGEAA